MKSALISINSDAPRCFKLLGHCKKFTYLLRFFSYFMTFCVLIYLIDHVYISLTFDFWQVFLFGIQHLAFDFWHLLLAYSVKHFVSVSSVTFGHLYSTHAFQQRLGSVPSLAEAVRIVSRSIRLHVHLNILQTYWSVAFLLNAKITLNLLI